ncbi:MAG: class I SAM-dependent methyltransferase [Ignavibacteria bacterium]|nr:class I SAM-dependent methyltransferase [Ignavibacteria bacterium]
MDLRPYYENDIEYIDHVVLQHESEIREMCLHILNESSIKKVIEIGTYEGGTAYIWSQLVDRYDGQVFCIDKRFGSQKESTEPWPCGASNNIEPIYRNTPFSDRVIEIEGCSDHPKVLESLGLLLDGKKVDLLFHDGDHSYEMAKKDFQNYSPFVRPGGWIAICDWKDETHGVSKFWPEIKTKYESWEFVIQQMPHEKQKSHRWLGFKNGIGLIKWV